IRLIARAAPVMPWYRRHLRAMETRRRMRSHCIRCVPVGASHSGLPAIPYRKVTDTMKLRSILLPIALLAALGTQHAFAQEGKTRERVGAELAQAIRSGDILAEGDVALPLNQLRPDLYPRAPMQARSRAEVKAETIEALRAGDIVAGESGYTLNQTFPNLY